MNFRVAVKPSCLTHRSSMKIHRSVSAPKKASENPLCFRSTPARVSSATLLTNFKLPMNRVTSNPRRSITNILKSVWKISAKIWLTLLSLCRINWTTWKIPRQGARTTSGTHSPLRSLTLIRAILTHYRSSPPRGVWSSQLKAQWRERALILPNC